MTIGPLRFTNALGGTADWIYPGPTIDMQSPASAGAVDGTIYLIYAQSFDMAQWEIATGAYTASSGTFARTTVLANSLGTTAKINFGTPPQVFVLDATASRPQMTTNRTYYVRTDGSDSNNGLSDTSGGAFLTIAKALSVAASIDMGSSQLTIQVDAGTWTVPVSLPRMTGALRPIFTGVGSTTFISVNSSDADAITNDGGTPWQVNNLKVAAAGTSASGLRLINGGIISYSGIEFGACAGFGVRAMGFTSAKMTGPCTVSGGGQGLVITNGFVEVNAQWTFISAVTYSLATFSATKSGGELDCLSATFVNPSNVTGPRYFATLNGVIFTGSGGSATFIPGTVAGSTTSGGQYS